MNNVVTMRDVTKIYVSGDTERAVSVEALAGVDVDVFEGEYVAIMGPSGSGKSTLMHIIGLLDSPTAGSYKLSDVEVSGLSEIELAHTRNQRIGFVFQAFFLLPRLTALRNVELPLIYRGMPAAERMERSLAALKMVDLTDRMDHLPNEMSGGQKQRVAVARALVQEPDMLLADEPTGNLDTKSSMELMDVFDELSHQGKTIIMVTHEADIGARAKRIIHVRDGRIEG